MLKNSSLEYIRAVVRKYDIDRAYLFGSCLEKSEEEAGDIDLAIEKAGEIGIMEFLRMHGELDDAEALGGKNVDIVNLDMDAPINILIRDEMELVYEKPRP